jgi:flagellar biosynthesis protein
MKILHRRGHLASISKSNPKKKAVALNYDSTKQGAPRVSAKGEGEIAQTIIRLAKENSVPIKEDADLVELLSKVEVDREIPPNLYKAVAEVFSFLYQMTREKSS